MGRLNADDWARAALDALAEGGLAAVAVEPVAVRLGVSKGSFYWHFPNRQALVEAALERWEAETEAVIAGLEPLRDPVERMRVLMERAFGDGRDAAISFQLISEVDDATAGAGSDKGSGAGTGSAAGAGPVAASPVGLESVAASAAGAGSVAPSAAGAGSAAVSAVGAVVRRVSERRLAYIRAALEEAGQSPEEAARRALAAYAGYLGLAALARIGAAADGAGHLADLAMAELGLPSRPV